MAIENYIQYITDVNRNPSEIGYCRDLGRITWPFCTSSSRAQNQPASDIQPMKTVILYRWIEKSLITFSYTLR